MTRARIVAAAALAAVGCGSSGPSGRVEKSRTFMLEKGDEPRFMLRYALPAGSTQTFTTYADVSVSVSGGGVDVPRTTLPRVVLDQQVDVAQVDPKTGAMVVSLSLAHVGTVDRPGVVTDPQVVAGFTTMEGMRMTGRLLPDGQTRDLRLDPSSVPASARGQLGDVERIFDQLVAVLPDVPVGKGAEWRLEETVRQGPLRVQIETSYELLEVSEDGATLRAVSELSAGTQAIEMGGVKVTLDSMTGRADVTTVIDLHRLVGRVTGSMTIDVAATAAGQHLEMGETLGIQCLAAGEQPEPPPQAPLDSQF